MKKDTTSIRSRKRRAARRAWLTLAGSVVLLIGLMLLIYPGPGWLVILGGLAILAKEFHWAERWLEALKKFFLAWEERLKQQHWLTQGGLFLSTMAVTLVTVWLLNGFWLLNEVAELVFAREFTWLLSPFWS